MRHRLQTRFILAGCLLVVATVGSSVWSAFTFVRLNQVVDDTIRVSQETIDLSTELHSSLEREDDALLLFLSGNIDQARRDLEGERRRGDARFEKLARLVGEGDERALAVELRQRIDCYRAAGDALLNPNGEPGGLEQYHVQVNPLLRRAVAGCDKLREENFRSMQDAGVRARDEAARGTRWVVAISVLTVALGIAVSVWLARSILVPIRDLIVSVEEIRKGDFDRRVRYISDNELGQLGSGFNRMAEALAEYRRSSLGELLSAKMTIEATLNALPDAVLVFEPDRTLVAMNPLAQRILIARGCETAKKLEELKFNSDFAETVQEALSGQPPVGRRMDFVGSLSVVLDNEERRFLVTAVPIPEFPKGRFGAVVVMDDVTEFARLDELRSELIGVASHELKSPLTALQMNLLMLREEAENLPKRQVEILEAAIGGCQELGQTIDELLDVTRIEAGQLRLHEIQIEARTLIAASYKSLQTRFEDAGVRLDIKIADEPVVLIGDPVRLQSVLTNLLSNALKYSPAGGRVVVEVVSGQNAQTSMIQPVQIAVTDQGPGVPAEFRERIFEKFFRIEHQLGNRENTLRGTGIGLYLCRQIIKSHGGTISCEAGEDGIGTRIAITLPADE